MVPFGAYFSVLELSVSQVYPRRITSMVGWREGKQSIDERFVEHYIFVKIDVVQIDKLSVLDFVHFPESDSVQIAELDLECIQWLDSAHFPQLGLAHVVELDSVRFPESDLVRFPELDLDCFSVLVLACFPKLDSVAT